MRANFRRIGPHISVSYASNFALLAYFNSDARKPAKIAEVKNPCDETRLIGNGGPKNPLWAHAPRFKPGALGGTSY